MQLDHAYKSSNGLQNANHGGSNIPLVLQLLLLPIEDQSTWDLVSLTNNERRIFGFYTKSTKYCRMYVSCCTSSGIDTWIHNGPCSTQRKTKEGEWVRHHKLPQWLVRLAPEKEVGQNTWERQRKEDRAKHSREAFRRSGSGWNVSEKQMSFFVNPRIQ